jgi:UDP-N-acetylmuramoyl-tripeptide--D-alanyl-D-alanine ligase
MAEGELWTIADLVAATGGALHGMVSQSLTGVAIDSRSSGAGDIFVAIIGERVDGHDYVVSALAAGAGLAIVARADETMKAAGPLLLVAGDPLRALEAMARAARVRSGAQIVAVTGSVGKTSSKELLRLALGASGETHCSAASFNNHWGVPLSLARLHARSAYGVFEIGMSHAGEITPLVEMVRPHVAIITTIAASHLGHFSSVAEIAAAKAEIFKGLVADGVAIIPRDSAYYDVLEKAAGEAGVLRRVSFGKHEKADIRLVQVALHPNCCCITADILGERVIYKLGVAGEHMALNSLAVLAAVKVMGADLGRAALALADAVPAKGRGQQQRLKTASGEFTLIDESYNANPASVRAAVALLAQQRPAKGGRRIAVLGDMLELGAFGPQLHGELADVLDEGGVDVLYAAGPLMSHLWNQTGLSRRGAYASSASDLAEAVLKDVRAGDVVMIKGSNGSRMGLVADALRARFAVVSKEI